MDEEKLGFYQRVVVPFLLDRLTDTRELRELRHRVLAPARGRVLEIGFGTGLNAAHYPEGVDVVVAIDPHYAKNKRAGARIARVKVPIELRPGTGEQIPADDASFDCVVTSLVLCSVADPNRTLLEVRRVLKPGGHYLFLEHGLADEPKVRRWQNRLNGLNMRLGGGCRLNRPIAPLLEQAGFRFESLERRYLAGAPRPNGFVTFGCATA